MKPKTVILLVVAVGCGLVASVMTSRLIADRGDGPQEKMVKVLVTKAKIRQFDLLKEPQKLFVEKEIPESAAHKKAVHSFDELKDKRVARSLTPETTITTEDLVNKDLSVLANDLVPGSRAMAFRVTPECLAGGFVLPASRVDILHTMRQGDKPSTRTIMQNMLVLAVDMNPERDPEKRAMLGNTVTMAVRPNEAERLTLASQTGELRLVLRPLGEDKPVSVKGATIADLLRPGSVGESEGSDTEPKETPGNLAGQVPTIPTLPMTEKKEPEKTPETPLVVEPVVKKHTLTIIQGDQVQKVTFNKGVDGVEAPPTTPTPVPKQETPSKTEPPTPEKSADATPARDTVANGSNK